MAKGEKNAVYRVTDVIGTSAVSWEDAARSAVKTGVEVAARPAHRRGHQARRQGRERQGDAVPHAPFPVVQVRGLMGRSALADRRWFA